MLTVGVDLAAEPVNTAVARAAALGLTPGPPPTAPEARTEGWIAVPTGTLADLLPS